jgi:Peptidase M15
MIPAGVNALRMGMPQVGMQPTHVALGPFDRDGMSPEALAFADAFSAATGPTVYGVNSAHRDAAHNAAVGGARGSQHIQGNALDIDVSGIPIEERIALIETARGLGAGGVGAYDNSLHFDVGPTRAWGPDYSAASIPDWARGAVGAERAPTGPAGSPAPVMDRPPENPFFPPQQQQQPQVDPVQRAYAAMMQSFQSSSNIGQAFKPLRGGRR